MITLDEVVLQHIDLYTTIASFHPYYDYKVGMKMRNNIPPKVLTYCGDALKITIEANEIITGIEYYSKVSNYENIIITNDIGKHNGENMELYEEEDGDYMLGNSSVMCIREKHIPDIIRYYEKTYGIPKEFMNIHASITSKDRIHELVSSIPGIRYPKGLKLYYNVIEGSHNYLHSLNSKSAIIQIYRVLYDLAQEGYWCPETFHLLPPIPIDTDTPTLKKY